MLEIPRDKLIHAVNGGHRNVDGIGSSPIWNQAAPNKTGRHGTDVFDDRESMSSAQQCQPCRNHLRLALLGLLDRLQRREEVKPGTTSVPPKAGTRLPRCLDQAGRRPGHVVARNRRLYEEESEPVDRLPSNVEELKASKSGLVAYLFLSGKDKEAIAAELKAAFKLPEAQAVKVVRRITGRARFFQRVGELMAAK